MSFLPIIKDLLPIVMPSSVQVTKSTELDAGTGQTEGMIRKGAIVNKSDKICASGEYPGAVCAVFVSADPISFFVHTPILSSPKTLLQF